MIRAPSILLLALLGAAPALGAELGRGLADSGGGRASGGSTDQNASVGQPALGSSSNAGHELRSGFLHPRLASATPSPTPSPTPSFSPLSTSTLSATPSGTPSLSVTPSPTLSATAAASPSPSPTPSPSSSFTPLPSATPSTAPTGPGFSLLAPVPSRAGEELCLSLKAPGASGSCEIHNSAGELAARIRIEPSSRPCLQAGALAPGVYLARLRVDHADGTREERLQKIAVLP